VVDHASTAVRKVANSARVGLSSRAIAAIGEYDSKARTIAAQIVSVERGDYKRVVQR
jgi:hypothetical protein